MNRHLIYASVFAGILVGINFLPRPILADDTTSGSVQLVLPSTGISANRPGEKINTNFRIVAATITAILSKTNAIAVDTTTLRNIAAVDTTTLKSRLDAVATDTTTLFTSDKSTGVALSNFITNVSNSTSAVINSNVGSFTNTNITVNAQGQVTAATNGSSGGSGATVAGSTQTIILRVNNPTLSTITVNGLGAYVPPSPSTFTTAAIWASCLSASTVGYTLFTILKTTGAQGGTPLAPSQFPPMSISTGNVVGQFGWSGVISTAVRINAGESYGVGVSSFAATGTLANGCAVYVDAWEFGRY